ncbi:MAG: Rrf2 family transcriptional regulator [Cellvibrionales bacterium]|nr:Rrf2 family transcriptional regulator [Cellvibrionales bacterium]
MRLTTKGRYAVTAALDLAIHRQDGPVSLADISRRQAISLSYLEQLFAKLRQHRLVASVRGPGGGYRLTAPPSETYLSAIVAAVDEPVDATNCGGEGDCQNGAMCLTHHLWEDLTHQIESFLSNISLQCLLDRREIAQISQRQDRLMRSQIQAQRLEVSQNLN